MDKTIQKYPIKSLIWNLKEVAKAFCLIIVQTKDSKPIADKSAFKPIVLNRLHRPKY
jgi:hypothetical protein